MVLLLVSCRSAPVPAAPALRDFRGVIHVHSFHSHDSRGTYEEILAACKKRGIDFVCMTDHPPKGDPGRSLREGWRGLHDGVLFIQGAEYGDQIMALGIREPISSRSRRERIEKIHAQGGVAIVCHPEEVDDWNFDGFDGMEIWNTHAIFKELLSDPKALLQALKLAREDLEGAWMTVLRRPEKNLAKWDELNKVRRVVGIAGNDAHQNTNVMGVQLDPYDVSLGFVTTHVLAEELTEEAVLRALKEGRAYVAFEWVAPEGTGGAVTTVVEALREEVTVGGRPWIYRNPRGR
ncbi:MAG: CehA/McbA family metallohydrolase [Planctomycetes bacterium]|nr:CehA/McbA family metallohydrolase [Planctomycetota bacterium]